MYSWEVLEWALYMSYCAQRDKWFDPSKAGPKTVKVMRQTYPNLDEYEQKYMKEQYERNTNSGSHPRTIEYECSMSSASKDTSLRKNGS